MNSILLADKLNPLTKPKHFSLPQRVCNMLIIRKFRTTDRIFHSVLCPYFL